jgi:hypothetical protein
LNRLFRLRWSDSGGDGRCRHVDVDVSFDV